MVNAGYTDGHCGRQMRLREVRMTSAVNVRPAQPKDLAALGRLGVLLVAEHHQFDRKRFLGPDECGDEYQLDGCKTLCNVGSVGQPRDGDWRACYVLFDGRTIRFRRVKYEVEATIGKIYANPELDDWLAPYRRFWDGRLDALGRHLDETEPSKEG